MKMKNTYKMIGFWISSCHTIDVQQWISIDKFGICKVVIYNCVFVGFYSVLNLIVIIFNLKYPVLFVRFICKDCVWERECEDWRQIEDWSVFAGILGLSFSWSEVCALHMTGMQRVRIGWRQLVFSSISQVRPSRKTLVKHSVLPDCHFWYTLSVPKLYIPTLPTVVEKYFWEKTLATNIES